MIVSVRKGRAEIWRSDHGEPPQLNIGQFNCPIEDEQALRDLHECLDFLYGRTEQ